MTPTRDAIQADAIEAIIRERTAGQKSTLLHMPTQVGKTRAICKYIARGITEWHGRFLVVAHMGELLDQFGKELDDMKIAYAKEQADSRAYDVMSLNPGIRVCLASKDSMQDREWTNKATGERKRSERLSLWPCDFFTDLIEDECHLSVADTWQKVHKHFAGIFRVGLTATIDRLDGVPLSKVFESVAYSYSIRDAIANGHRVPFRAIRCDANIDIRGIKADAMGKLAPGELEARVGPRLEELANVVRMQMDRIGIGKAIAFLPNRALAYAFAKFLDDIKVSARGICGVNKERDEIIQAHRSGQFRVLTNSKLLGMGYNDPGLDAVIDLAPTTSRAWFDQKAGRCGATRIGKEFGYLLYIGWESDLDLIGPTDIFAYDESDVVKAMAKALARKNKGKDVDPLKLLEDAREAVAEADRLQRIEDQRRLQYEARKRDVRHKYSEFDPIGVARLGGFEVDPSASTAQPTMEQIARLMKLGVKPPSSVTAAEAEAAAEFWDERELVGFLSPKQYEVIRKFSDPAKAIMLTKKEASRVMAALMNRVPPKQLASMVDRFSTGF